MDGTGSVGVQVAPPGDDGVDGVDPGGGSPSGGSPGGDGPGSGDAAARPSWWRRYVGRFTLPGCWGALILACFSFTPSLLPRGGFLQGLLCGITAAIGYGLGVALAWVGRAFADREAGRPSRRDAPAQPPPSRG